ncbi:hypothetical protein BMS3Bbin10_00127 [bacterium BMS3Bbin10]|nr:hypothetical protein BMS3Bbin10_00127 [bacterium BMS3Bbin10]HDL16909.1 hypothetical protein [Hyphomicrobiales bacterium]
MEKWPLDKLQGRKSFEDWSEFFATLTPYAVGEVCVDAMSQDLGVPESLNFYSAGINRLRDMAQISTALTDAQRDAAMGFSKKVLSYVEAQFVAWPDALERLRDALSYSDEFYQIWGTEAAREFLYERGFYDEYGVQLKPMEEEDEGPPRISN